MTETETLAKKSGRTRPLSRLARLGIAALGLSALVSTGATASILDSGTAGATVSTAQAAAATSSHVSCGAKLSWDMNATWVVPGVNDLFTGFSSNGYYYYCGDIVTQSLHPVCSNLYYALIDFECSGHATYGVIGEGTSHVNPWYNQPVNIVVLSPEDDFPSVGIYGGTIYCRTNFYSSGKYNNNCSLTITSHTTL
jgi:hypothetical protein